jgi:RNA polymerase sigma factor (sigma-70 family)
MLRTRKDEDSARIEDQARGDEPAERRLLARVAAGEMRAFELLYRGYHPRLTRFLERVTRRPELVEELLNDTMLVVWRRADHFNGSSKVSTWIFAIAYRKALKALQRWDLPVDDEAVAQQASPQPGPEESLDRHQLHAQMLRALDQLSAVQRAVVALTYFHGMDYREIAEVIDCPVDTVKTRMFHARRRLKAMLAGAAQALP